MKWFKKQFFSCNDYFPSSLEQLEEYRIEMRQIIKRRQFISYVLCALLIIPAVWMIYNNIWLDVLIPSGEDKFFYSLFYAACTTSIFAVWWRFPYENYSHAYRNYHTKTLEDNLEVSDVKFSKGGVSMEQIIDSLIAPTSLNESAFYITMSYKNSKLTFADTENRHEHRYSGSCVFIELPKDVFYANTIVTKDRHKIEENRLGKILNMKKVNLVDPVFEDLFDVYSEDQVEARFIFNPAFIEEYRGLSYNHHPLIISFYDKRKAAIMVSNLKLKFKPDIHLPADHNVDIKRSESAIRHILGLIDVLLPEAYVRKAG